MTALFLCNNCINHLFHAILFEAVPLQTDAASSAIVPLLEAFSDNLCLLFARTHCNCSRITMMLSNLLPFDAKLGFCTCDCLRTEMWVSLNFPEGPDTQQHESYASISR
jgi:p-aminobenzoyl-glutamate transporter AbgT